jgi:hypothetical protein
VDHEARPRESGARHLLEHDHIEEVVGRGAAVLLRHGAAQHACGAGLQPQLARYDAGLFPLRVIGRDLVVDEPPNHAAECLMVFVEQISFEHLGLPCDQ